MTTTPQRNIFLIGPMGAGKTAVGQQLARLMNYTHYDADTVIEERSGVSISWIFDQEGETGFRKRECAIILELTDQHPIVLSTGGGSILNAQNRKILAERGIVIHLTVSLKEQLKRTGRRPEKRPLLQTHDPSATLIAHQNQRSALYEEIADLTYPTDGSSPRALAEEIYKTICKQTR